MLDFWRALSVQNRVVYAFILRETRTRFGRTRLGYFWALFEPLAYIGTMVLIFGALGRGAPIDADITLFFFSAIIPWLMFTRIMSSLSSAIDANQQLLTYPHVKVLDLMLAKVILEFATLLVVAIIYLLFTGLVLETFHGIERIADVLLGLFLATLLGVGMGLVGSSIRLYFPAYSNFQGVITRLLFFTSGLFFVADGLPREIQQWLWYNPVLHIIEWVRSAFFPGFESHFFELWYPVLCIMVLLYLGLASERVSRTRLRQV